jgi:hypothetical protein
MHHYERLPRKEMSLIELDEIPNPCKNLYPRFKDPKAQALGIGFSRSRAQNNDQESAKSQPKTTKKTGHGEKI